MDLFFLVESIPLSVPGHAVTNGIWMLSSPAYPEVFSRERKIWFFQPLPNENPYVVKPSEIGRKITDSIYHRVGITTCSKTFAELWSELKNLRECAKVVSDFYLSPAIVVCQQ